MPTNLLTRILLALLLCGLLASCVGSAPAAVDPSAAVVAVPAALAPRLAVAASAYASAGGGSVRVEAVPAAAYERRVGEVLTAGLRDYDLLVLPSESLAKWVGYHALQVWEGEQLDEPGLDLERWLPRISVEGAVYGLPAQADPLLIWQRVDFGEAAIQDYESLLAFAQASAAPPERYGYLAPTVPGSGAGGAALDLAAFLHLFGAQAVREVGAGRYAPALTEPSARAALAAYAALRRDASVSPPMVPASPLSDPARAAENGRQMVVEGLREGRAGLGFAARSAGETLLDCSAKSPTCQGERPLLSAAQIPGACTLLAGLSVWAVPLRAERAQEAMRFAAWLNTQEGARAWSAQVDGDEFAPVHPAALEEDACFAAVFPPLTQPAALWEALGQLADDLALGADVDRSAAQAQEAIGAALRSQGKLSE